MELLPPSAPHAVDCADHINAAGPSAFVDEAPSAVAPLTTNRTRDRAVDARDPTPAEHDSATERLLALVPVYSPRGKYRITVQAYLPAILTARRNGNSWTRIAEIVGIKPDALRKAVASLTAAPTPVAPRARGATSPVSERTSTRRGDGPREAADQAPRPAPVPTTHAGLRRKDARI